MRSVKPLTVSQVNPFIWRGPAPSDPVHFTQLQHLGIDTLLSVGRSFADRISRDRIDSREDLGLALGMRTISLRNSLLFPPDDDIVDAAFEIMGTNRTYGNIYIHCQDGANRTGFICAAWQTMHEGKSKKDSIREMLALGFHANCNFWWLPHLEQYLSDRGGFV